MTKMFLLAPWRVDLSTSFLVTHFRLLHQNKIILSVLKIYLLTLEIIASGGYLQASSVFIWRYFFPQAQLLFTKQVFSVLLHLSDVLAEILG